MIRAVTQELGHVGAPAGDLHHGKSAQGEPRRPDAPSIDDLAHRLVRQHAVDHGTEIAGSFPTEDEPLQRAHVLDAVAWMVHGRRDETSASQRYAEPSELNRRTARSM
ncbi:MAG: hypothetical protein ABSF35_24825 [Polyangia bacterium]